MLDKRSPAVRSSITLAVAWVILPLAACGSQASEAPAAAPEPAPAPAEAPKPTAEAPAEAPKAEAPKELTDTIEDPSFELKLVPSGPYAAGKLASFGVSLVPKGEYHVNQDFPMTIAIKAPDGVTLPKAKLEKGDAAEFAEKKARFDVPFTAAAAGEHRVECDINFAVCTPETCVPDERTLALNLAVE